MHAIQNVNADPVPYGGSVAAAMTDISYRPISNMMSSLDLESKLRRGTVLSVTDVDAAISASGRQFTSVQRIQLKQTLMRLGLLS